MICRKLLNNVNEFIGTEHRGDPFMNLAYIIVIIVYTETYYYLYHFKDTHFLFLKVKAGMVYNF